MARVVGWRVRRPRGGRAGACQMNLHDFATRLGIAYTETLRPFFEEFAPDRVAQFDEEIRRCLRLRDTARRELPVCVLGQSGVGKSTLLNSLLDGRMALLPQGGVGPLTAQATSVRFSEKPYFRVSYLPGNRLNQLLFALLKHHEAEERRRGASADADLIEVQSALSPEELEEARASLPAEDLGAAADPDAGATEGAHSKVDGYRHQANLIVRGKQYANLEIPYLAHCLRAAIGLEPKTSLVIEPEDQKRLEEIQRALAVARSTKNERCVELSSDKAGFLGELKTHVTGHLAPLIKTLEVGWDNRLLADGLVLVDLPGVGVANDEYRRVTAEAIRTARAVVLVVDRSGFTQASADLLRSTGFLTSLLHDAHDPEADVPLLFLAVVKLDLTADDARREAKEAGRDPRAWVDYFNDACRDAVTLVRDQVRNELQQVATDGPESTREARLQMVDRITGDLRIHPVSALEYRRLSLGDEEDRPRIKQPADSRIPQMAAELQAVAERAIQDHKAKFRQQALGLRQRVSTVLDLLREQWTSDERLGEEVERLRKELELQMKPLDQEYRDRRANFRGFLRETVPEKIQAGVYKATEQARQEIDRYVRSLHDYHWATLRAAVRRGGAFVGARHVDLPNELTLRFEEPVAVVWSRDILAALRKRTKDWGDDLVSLQAELVRWATSQGARVDSRRVQRIHEDLQSGVKELAAVGREAVDELKARVRTELFSKVEANVRKKCEKFVADKQAEGPGVKRRILELFGHDLTDTVLGVAQASATKVLTVNYEAVQEEIQAVLKRFPDPLQTAAQQIVDSHELSRKRADGKERRRFGEGLSAAVTALPDAPQEGPVEITSPAGNTDAAR